MIHWLRMLLSVFALAGLLTAWTGAAAAAESGHHCCPGMEITHHMAMAGHHKGNGHGPTEMPACCAAGVCSLAPPIFSTRVASPAHRRYAEGFSPLRNDAGPQSLVAPPDLRPPIA